MINHYKTLNLEFGATDAQIKKQFRKLAFQYHPDTNPGDATAEVMMKKINASYAVLSNPAQKKWLDYQLGQKSTTPFMAKPTYSNKSTHTTTSTFTWTNGTGKTYKDTHHYQNASKSPEFQKMARKIIGCFSIVFVATCALIIYAIYVAFSK